MRTGMTIKDGRKRNWWWARNEIFDQWGPILKSNGLAVYLCLCRHANNRAECWPSFQRIARECGIHRTTVIKNIKLLESYQLICSESRLSNSGDPDTNTYTILDIPKLPLESSNSNKNNTKPIRGSRSQLLPVVVENDYPSSPELPPVVVQDYQGSSPELPKGNTIKETNLKETNLRTTTTTTSNLSSGEILERRSSSNSKEIIKGNKKPTVLAAVESVQDSGLVFDYALKDFSSEQKQRALNLLKDVPTEDKQSVLDEFNSAIEQGTVKSIWRYFSKLIQNYHAGQFNSTSELPEKRTKTQSESKSTENTQQQIRECPYCNDGGTLSFEFPDNRFMTKPCNHNHEEIISFITKYNVKFDFPSNIFTPTQYPQNYKEIVSIITKHNAKMASSDRFNHTKPTQSIETKPLSKSQAQAKLAAMIGGFQKE